jgi:hypothetical protein
MSKTTKRVLTEVTATIGYKNRHGSRRYRCIVYQVEHWNVAMAMLLATDAYIELSEELWKFGRPHIYGITFNFKPPKNQPHETADYRAQL